MGTYDSVKLNLWDIALELPMTDYLKRMAKDTMEDTIRWRIHQKQRELSEKLISTRAATVAAELAHRLSANPTEIESVVREIFEVCSRDPTVKTVKDFVRCAINKDDVYGAVVAAETLDAAAGVVEGLLDISKVLE